MQRATDAALHRNWNQHGPTPQMLAAILLEGFSGSEVRRLLYDRVPPLALLSLPVLPASLLSLSYLSPW